MALLEDVILRGDRASQPAAGTVAVGTLYCVTDEGDIVERSSGSAWEAYSPSATAATVNMAICSARLSLTSGTPVTTSDVTGATSVYLSPYSGKLISLFDGADWQLYNLSSPLSLAVPSTTATMYDVFLDYNAGTPQLQATAWTNDTTRATALTTQDGVYVQTGNLDWRYLGSFRTGSVSGQTEDSLALRYVWNYYNRVLRPMKVIETTNSWTTVTTSTIQQVNVAAANQLDFVCGIAEDTLNAFCQGLFTNSGGTWRTVHMGFGINSTTAFSQPTLGAQLIGSASCAATVTAPINASLSYIPAVGRTFIGWLQQGAGADTQTWYGDNNSPTNTQSGIWGWIRG